MTYTEKKAIALSVVDDFRRDVWVPDPDSKSYREDLENYQDFYSGLSEALRMASELAAKKAASPLTRLEDL